MGNCIHLLLQVATRRYLDSHPVNIRFIQTEARRNTENGTK